MKSDDPDSSSTPDARWETQPLEWPRAAGQVDQLTAAVRQRERQQRRRRALGVVGGALALVVAIGVYRVHVSPAASGVGTVAGGAATASNRGIVRIPEKRVLPDGTIAELKSGAELAVEFGAGAPIRRVRLVRGEVHFQVAKDASRPFVVEARGVRFRAVGTAFSVELGTAAVEMVVTEGRVAVESPSRATSIAQPKPARDSSPPVVAAGHRAVVEFDAAGASSAPAIAAASAREITEQLAWRIPRLEFGETPLSEVAVALAEHGGVRLRLADPALGALSISGALRADNVEPLLQMLEANYGVQSIRRDTGEIELRKR